MLALADLFFRLSAVGVLVVGAIVLARGAGRATARWLVAAFSLCVAAYLLSSSTEMQRMLGVLDLPLKMLSIAAPALLWMAALALFDDGLRLRARHFIPLALLEGSALTALYGGGPDSLLCRVTGYGHQGTVLILYAAAVVAAFKESSGDLVEARRRFRFWFVACASTTGVAIAVAELVLWGQPVPAALELVKVVVIAVLVTTLVAWALDLKPMWFAAEPVSPRSLASPGELSPAERQMLNALRQAIETEKACRRNGLTITALAAQTRIPEHALRKLINQRLGHRNFNAFLNQYRIAEVKAALADPGRARLPVLTLALDAGFASVGPFNRAFKEACDMTPTQYRQSQAATESERIAPIPESAIDRRS